MVSSSPGLPITALIACVFASTLALAREPEPHPQESKNTVTSELRIEEFTMPAGRLGPENPLPPLRQLARTHGEVQVHESVPEEARRYLGYGLDTGLLPYGIQDDYGRDRLERAFRVAVLENSRFKATFLLELGGRLWSLVHKPSGRELLYRNPVFQPANLAVRNAWFSGGVEWNCSIQGHTPFTCSPVHAAIIESPDGTPVLRILEARALLELGRLEEAAAFLDEEVDVPDIREGEVTLSDLWFALHERRLAAEEGVAVDDALRERVRREFPPPRRIDFRMAQ